MSFANTKAPRSQFGMRGLEGGAPSQTFQNLQGEAIRRQADNSKRTIAITLAAMGAGAVGLYYVAGGSRLPAGSPVVFTSVEKCVAAAVHENGVCEMQWNEAAKVHAIAAPAYDTADDCEKTHGVGKCITAPGQQPSARAGKYVPVMSGYFFGTTPQGTFKGVPLYSVASDGPDNYRVAEIPPKEPEVEEKPKLADSKPGGAGDGTSASGNGSSRTLLFIPALAAPSAAAAGAAAGGAAAARAGAVPASGMGAPAPRAGLAPASGLGAPAAAAPAAAATTSRGGFGGAAHAGGSSGG